MAKSSITTPDQLAKIRKKELNMADASKAMAEVERQAIAVRKNMERLKALRLARDIEIEAEKSRSDVKKKLQPAKKASSP